MAIGNDWVEMAGNFVFLINLPWECLSEGAIAVIGR
jgi:hypothetical protein